MDEQKRSRIFDPYHPQRAQPPGRLLLVRSVLSLIFAFGFSFSLTCLYLAMRGIMRLGGFVASGGPYEIAHPAPRYVWIFPVSIIVGLICLFLQVAQVKRVGGLNLLALAWPALFISLGWNFLEFGFHPPGGQGLAWGWLVCGVVFWLMGFIPLVFLITYYKQKVRERKQQAKLREGLTPGQEGRDKWRRRMVLLFQLIFLAAGIYAAVVFLSPQTKAQESPSAAAATRPAARPRTAAEPIAAPVPRASGAEGTSSIPIKVTITIRGKRLEIVEEQAGTCRLDYEGRSYGRLSDIPSQARRLFMDALKILQALVVENR
jgi:uncharacterized membrane protein